MIRKKKVLINASTVKISGGLFIALDIISALLDNQDIHKKIICPDIRPFRRFQKNTETKYVPEFFFHYIFRPILDYWWLNKQINKFDADLVVSLSNLPARIKRKQVFFHDNAFMSASDLRGLNLSIRTIIINTIRRGIFRSRIRFIDRLIVQTELEQNRLNQKYGPELPITILPPMLLSHLETEVAGNSFSDLKNNFISIGYLSRYFEHKNIEILLEVVEICKEQNLPFQFAITIDKNQGRGADKLLRKIAISNNSQRIINLGKIGRKRISSLVQSVDALILPSLIETFGLNCMEAWYHDKPIFVADRDYSREVCGNAAVFFDPHDAESIVKALKGYFIKRKKNKEIIEEGRIKISQLSTANDVVENIISL